MVIDTSALIAILLNEPKADRLMQALASTAARIVGAPTIVEASAVMLARKGSQGEIALDALLQRTAIDIEPMSPEAATFARQAYARFGKGVSTPGVLNYGDCLSYGVAMATAQPLLFTGNDFSRTDVMPAEY